MTKITAFFRSITPGGGIPTGYRMVKTETLCFFAEKARFFDDETASPAHDIVDYQKWVVYQAIFTDDCAERTDSA